MRKDLVEGSNVDSHIIKVFTDVIVLAPGLGPIFQDITTIDPTTGAKVFEICPVDYLYVNGSAFMTKNFSGINFFGGQGPMPYPSNFADPFIAAPGLVDSTGHGAWAAPIFLAAVEELIMNLYVPQWYGMPLYTSVPGEPPYLVHYVSMSLSLLGGFLSNVQVTPNNVLAIIQLRDTNGLLMATNTNYTDFYSINGTQYYASASPNPVVRDMGSFLSTLSPSDLQGAITSSFSSNGVDYFISTQYISDQNGLSWVLVLTIPKTDLWGTLESTREKAILAAFFVGLAMVILAVIATYFVTRPMKVLGKNMQQATKFDFSFLQGSKDARRTSVFLELHNMETVFYHMLEKFATAIKANQQLMTRGSPSGPPPPHPPINSSVPRQPTNDGASSTGSLHGDLPVWKVVPPVEVGTKLETISTLN
ncbi:hypothetical protein BDK51DRAFT_27690 [Blyttiomyces helicus]|uniref:Uncharacterized protein n=1 Tax=Blyttiomyces helicus TaxID=388810 RepID=A0A4P9W6F6_9FUNG|nr:hypothetical protein BDK51DRAFT_27690 [Blyttiomyces helicus]|eukprot:RKO86945.1 hypothetical protein BDK51DRAFT_27690 [Blyttiomyces helicus]